MTTHLISILSEFKNVLWPVPRHEDALSLHYKRREFMTGTRTAGQSSK